ncbi:MAG: hypothetical protein J2P55_01335 [Rhizobiales bacterium]|nr:hypothetical protein [Hyphomicrobiales bacterium]
MPRRSRDDLTVVPMTPGAGRPEPPAELDDDERAAWQEIVGALPANWFKTEALPLLRNLVGHIVMSRELARRLRQDRTTLTLDQIRKIGTLQARESSQIAKLSAALRLSPKSQYAPRTAANRSTAKAFKPWDIRGRD